jgi:hypothetical protein
MEESKRTLKVDDLQDLSEYLQSLAKMTQIQAKISKDIHGLVLTKVQDLFLMLKE